MRTAAPQEVQDYVTDMQRRLWPRFLTSFGWVREPWHPPMVFDAKQHMAHLRANLRRDARWWELEAMRGYTGVIDENGKTSSDRSRIAWLLAEGYIELRERTVDLPAVNMPESCKQVAMFDTWSARTITLRTYHLLRWPERTAA